MPFPEFVAAGALANGTSNTLSVVAPAGILAGDILVCALMSKLLTTALSAPDGTWTQLIQQNGDCTTAADDHRLALFWRRAPNSADSGATFAFTRASGTSLYCGVISAWRGARADATPIDATAVGAQLTVGAADNVTFPAFDPTETEVHVLFHAFYGNDLTTFAAAMSSDTNPDCTKRFDLETATGTDATIACTSGTNDGSNIASRTWASASTTDAGSTGVVFAMVPKAIGLEAMRLKGQAQPQLNTLLRR